MQLIPRYLLKNRIIISASDAGFPTEFMPVYTRQLKIYKGIDNTVQCRLLNDDQKPINIANFTPKFVAFDENGTQVISHEGSINQLDDSSATRGLFTVTIFDNETAGLKKQYLRYNIYLLDENNNKIITYVDSHFDNNATTSLHPEVLKEMLPFLTTQQGNPASNHTFGRKAHTAIEEAREKGHIISVTTPSTHSLYCNTG